MASERDARAAREAAELAAAKAGLVAKTLEIDPGPRGPALKNLSRPKVELAQLGALTRGNLRVCDGNHEASSSLGGD